MDYKLYASATNKKAGFGPAFCYSECSLLHHRQRLVGGDIFISTERVADNAKDFKVSFLEELQRVMIHGVLHYIGFSDKTPGGQKEMTLQENNALKVLSNLKSIN